MFECYLAVLWDFTRHYRENKWSKNFYFMIFFCTRLPSFLHNTYLEVEKFIPLIILLLFFSRTLRMCGWVCMYMCDIFHTNDTIPSIMSIFSSASTSSLLLHACTSFSLTSYFIITCMYIQHLWIMTAWMRRALKGFNGFFTYTIISLNRMKYVVWWIDVSVNRGEIYYNNCLWGWKEIFIENLIQETMANKCH